MTDQNHPLETPTSPPAPYKHKGWYSRNYLPHLDQPDLIQAITFRLHDALPQQALIKIQEELKSLETSNQQGVNLDVERRKHIESYLDAGHGACYLRDPRFAGMIQDTLCYFDGERYRLLAWCVMPNHVHVVAEMLPDFALAYVVHSWKSYTAREANKMLHRAGLGC